MHGWLADIAAALALLTILPVPTRWQRNARWPRALRALPLVGALVGGIASLALVLAQALPPLATALLALLAGVMCTGALHEDGLADVADALGGGSRERRLEIMRDPRAGSFAILALLFAIGLQAAALTALLGRGAVPAMMALVFAHALSRLAALWMMFVLPHARADGMSVRAGRPDATTLGQGAVLSTVLTLALWPWLPGEPLLALVAVAVTAWLLRRLFRRLLGGQTGDVLGATEVLARTASLLALTV